MEPEDNITLNYFQVVFKERTFTLEEVDHMRYDLNMFFKLKGLTPMYIFQGNAEDE